MGIVHGSIKKNPISWRLMIIARGDAEPLRGIPMPPNYFLPGLGMISDNTQCSVRKFLNPSHIALFIF
jgi:hypothetical protein